jgi:hypothetical protein
MYDSWWQSFAQLSAALEAAADPLHRHGIGFKSPSEALDTTTTPGGRLVFHVFALLAEFIRGLIVEVPRRDWTPPAPATCASGGRRP